MAPVSRRDALLWTLAGAASAAGCAPSRTAPIGAGGEGAVRRTAPYVPFDVTWMIRPAHGRKYLGAGFPGTTVPTGALDAWTAKAGKAPNLLSCRLAWGETFRTDEVRAVFGRGILPYVVWEPWHRTLREIADGRDDDYVRRTAQSVRDLNVPVALAFAQEMNGGRYPWGSRRATPGEFVGAWRRIHDVFQDTGVSDVIWVWSPSAADAVKGARLEPYYPGDAYADWLGLVGYYTGHGPHTFGTLFGPAVEQVRAFTRIPVLVAETASAAGGRKAADIRDLVRGVTGRRDVVGFLWFDAHTETDWRIDSGPAALTAFRRGVADPRFGFDVRHP
ncbi:glycosyl hydrolase [Streptomyces sp. NPDC004542]|uniref:glycoside hydrolase family 26 protein n=1 Tax=Streptomyces sp. NPDC004542 TaxID=3154281 RepID=UPI0033A09F60